MARRIAMLAIVFLVVLTLIPTAPVGKGARVAAASRTRDSAVTITWWNPDIVTWQPTYKAIAAAFMKKYPQINVRVINVPESGYGSKVTTNIAGGKGPDVWVNHYTPELYPTSPAQPLNTFMAADHFNTNIWFQPAVRNALSYKGIYYGVPRDTGISALLYNADMFRKAHVALPNDHWTLWDAVKAAQKLTDPGKHQWGLNYESGFGVITDLSPILWDFGGSFVSDDGHKAVGYMDSPNTVKAVQFVWDLINKWKIVPPTAMMSSFGVAGSSSQGNAFLAGNAAMDPIDGDYAIGNLKTVPFKWGAVPYPTLPGHPHYAYIYPAGYTMWRGSKHKKEAWELMKFISSPAANAIVAKSLFWTPPTLATWTQFGMDKNPAWSAFWKSRDFKTKLPPWVAAQFWGDCTTPLNDLSSKIERNVVSRAAIPAQLKAIAKKVQACFDRDYARLRH
jgi:multiple sugar transport system substrate-binding protein